MAFQRALVFAQMATVAIGRVEGETECSPLGSGTVVDDSGLVVTSDHVVSDYDSYCISCARRPETQPHWCYNARVIKRDTSLDLALLRVETEVSGTIVCNPKLREVPLGDSNMVRTGDTIWVLGYPDVGGASVTVTRGMVAGFESHRSLIKTDAELSSGSSGGPAVTENGSLIGIPVKVRVQDTGKLGYLIAVNEVRRFLE
jgi:serine protease Do